MKKTTITGCVAPETSCGTASGWRQGGRCYRCREAHNRDQAERRGLNVQQRETLLNVLRAGARPEAAAESVSVSLAALAHAARTDGELSAALDDQPLEVQHAARPFGFLAVFVRTGGDTERACVLTGVTPGEVEIWRAEHDRYLVIENQARRWLGLPLYSRRPHRASGAGLDRAADALEAGEGIHAAARAAVSSPQPPPAELN